MTTTHGTTVLCVRRDATVAIGADGQVTLGDQVLKHSATKVRRLSDGRVLAAFAGATADAFTLLERFEARLKDHPSGITRAAISLAREWRSDRALRRLESVLILADTEKCLLLSGNGDVIEPDDGILATGSGGPLAAAAARALARHTDLGAEAIVREALKIAAESCIYTNDRIRVETLT